jgi:catechol 2,3-dioxygenase-like lactoylglutathione lyase family enzyme
MITGMPRIAIAVSDFDGIIATFRDGFGMPVIDFSESSTASLGAKLAMCVPVGGSNIELMCPHIADAPLSQSLQRFLDRRGKGLFALMLEAPNPNEEAERLVANGLNVLPLMEGAGGRDIHPNSTHGVLIRIYPVNSFKETMDETPDSLGLSGIAQVVIAVHDIEAAAQVYGPKLGLEVDERLVDSARGVGCVVVRPPSGGVIELVAVEDESRPYAQRLAAFLDERGEGMFELVLQTNDLVQANATLASRGIGVEVGIDGSGLQIARSDSHGAQISIQAC